MRTRSQAAMTIVPKHSQQTPPEPHRSEPPPPPVPHESTAPAPATATDSAAPLERIHGLVDQIVDTILDYKQRSLLDELVRALDALPQDDTETTQIPAPADAPVQAADPGETAQVVPTVPPTPLANAPVVPIRTSREQNGTVKPPPVKAEAPAKAEAPVITVIPRGHREARRKILRAASRATRPAAVDRSNVAVTPIPSRPVDAEPFSGAKPVVAYALIVEPDVMRQSAIISTLDEAGIKAQIVTGAESTLRTLSRLSFDVILVSLALADHESLDIVREIRRRETRTTNGQRIPVYGLAEPRDRIDGGRALAIGLDGILDAVPSAKTIQRLCEQWVAEREAETDAHDESIINTAALAGLRREPRETANRLLRHYLAAAARHISAIRRGISLGQMLSAEEACKALRAASAPFGAIGVVECCHTLEALIRGERPVKMRPLVEELDQLFRATRNHLQSIVSEL